MVEEGESTAVPEGVEKAEKPHLEKARKAPRASHQEKSMKREGTNPWVIVAILIILIAGGWFFYTRFTAPESPETPPQATPTVQEQIPAVQITPIGDKRLLANRKFSFKVQATGEGVTFSDDTNLFDIASDGSIAFTPTVGQLGDHKVTITAKDGAGNQDSVMLNFFVGKINHPPVVGPLGVINIEVGSTRVITVQAYDPDGDRLTYELHPLEQAERFGMDINAKGEIFWTPSTTTDVPMRVLVSDGTDVTAVDVYFHVY